MTNRKRINISVLPDTEQRLKQYALEHHTTVSQAITDWIWSVDIGGLNNVKKSDSSDSLELTNTNSVDIFEGSFDFFSIDEL